VAPDPDELLLQADHLVARIGATETDVRRAISAAYYAVFHFCLRAAADMVSGAATRSTPRYTVIYRSVDHKALRGLCGQLAQTRPQNIAVVPSSGFGNLPGFARVTANLGEQRNLADYDTSRSFTAGEARLAISEARQAILWFNSCNDEQQKAFLIMLLFRQR
jgi:hypothetical protein